MCYTRDRGHWRAHSDIRGRVDERSSSRIRGKLGTGASSINPEEIEKINAHGV
jgi:hypothetical protein